MYQKKAKQSFNYRKKIIETSLLFKEHIGKILTSSTEITDTFRTFSARLYSSECSPSEEELGDFLDYIHLPTLPLEEALDALKLTNKGCSPDIDAIPSRIYVFSFWETLGPL